MRSGIYCYVGCSMQNHQEEAAVTVETLRRTTKYDTFNKLTTPHKDTQIKPQYKLPVDSGTSKRSYTFYSTIVPTLTSQIEMLFFKTDA